MGARASGGDVISKEKFMSQVRKAFIVALVVVAVSALLLPLTAAAANWSSAFALGTGGLHPSVAIDSQGNQHYVWWDYNAKVIKYVRCTGLAGNGCSGAATISGGNSYYPSIAIDPQDRPNVVYESKVSDGAAYAIFWTRKQGSSWTSPDRISSEPYGEFPDISIGPGGKIHVVYQSKPSPTTGIVYYTSSDGSGFAPATELDQATSDLQISVGAEMADAHIDAAEGQQLSNGFVPRVAADEEDQAHAVWNVPSPYGIRYRYQNASGWSSTISVAGGQKDQTADVTVAPGDNVGILWGKFGTFNAAFAEYKNGQKDHSVSDIDGGLAQSLWPKIAADCEGNFHLVFQGRPGTTGGWNVYYRKYNPSNNNLAARQTIASISASEQTPVIAATDVAAIIYINTTNIIADAVTSDLGLNCTGEPPPPTNTPTPTNTPDPNFTPPAEQWIPNDSSDIIYRKTWRKINDGNATDGNYHRCEKDGVCESRSAAKIVVPEGYDKVEWFSANAKTYGIAKIWINDVLLRRFDMCKGNTGNAPKFITKTFDIPARTDGLPRTFEIGVPGKHTDCSPYNSNFVIVDGFKLK
jgi:hypothetical protein